jgi:glycosyltransferase 2 family protein
MKHPAFRYSIAILISAGALYLAFHKQHFHELAAQLEGANLFVILAGTLIMFLSHLIRAWRYKMLLRPIAPNTRLNSAFRALIAGYAMNNIVPRAGDVVRPVLFSKRERIPITSSVAVLLIERLTDLIGLSAILIVSLLLFSDEIGREFPAIVTFMLPIVLVLSTIFVFAVMILFSERKTRQVIDWAARWLPRKIRSSIEAATERIEQGLRGVREGSAIPVIIGTLGISMLYTCSMYVSTLAFPSTPLSHVGILACFLLQSMSGVAYILPSPGGTGTYHFLVSQALSSAFGVPLETSVAFATLTHASNYLLTTIVGIAFMFHDGISLTTVKAERSVVQEARRMSREARVPIAPLKRNETRVATL